MRAHAFTRRQFLTVASGAALAGRLADPPAPVRAQGLIPLNVGLGFHNLEAAAPWIAQGKQYFQRYGLDVNIIEFQGGAKSIAAVVSGEVPISLQSGVEEVNARARGFPIAMVAGLVGKFSFDFVAAKNITTPAQLRGTKGAISSFGALSDFAARFALTRLGISPAEVTLLPTGNESSRLAALQSGQIQFTVLTAGLDLVAFDLGYKPLLRLYNLDQPVQESGVAVNSNWAKAHRNIVESFLKGIVAANVFMKNRLNVAASIALLHKHLPIKEDLLRRGFELYRDKFFQVYPEVSIPGLEFIMKERKVTQPVTEFYDNSYLQALEQVNFAGTVKE